LFLLSVCFLLHIYSGIGEIIPVAKSGFRPAKAKALAEHYPARAWS
jgi:hypothetical protein